MVLERQKHTLGVLTREEIGALFDVWDLATERGRRDRVAVLLLLSAGLRAAEVLRLDWSDVDRREIGGLLRTVLHVDGRGRRRRRQLVVSEALSAALDAWRRDCDALGAALDDRRCDGGDLGGRVVRKMWRGGMIGPGLTEGGFFGLIARLGRAAGLEDLRPVALRRTSACGQVRARGLEYASLALGDADAGRTARGLGGCCEVEDGPVTLVWAVSGVVTDVAQSRKLDSRSGEGSG